MHGVGKNVTQLLCNLNYFFSIEKIPHIYIHMRIQINLERLYTDEKNFE